MPHIRMQVRNMHSIDLGRLHQKRVSIFIEEELVISDIRQM